MRVEIITLEKERQDTLFSNFQVLLSNEKETIASVRKFKNNQHNKLMKRVGKYESYNYQSGEIGFHNTLEEALEKIQKWENFN